MELIKPSTASIYASIQTRRGGKALNVIGEFRRKYCILCKLALTHGCDVDRPVDYYDNPDAMCIKDVDSTKEPESQGGIPWN